MLKIPAFCQLLHSKVVLREGTASGSVGIFSVLPSVFQKIPYSFKKNAPAFLKAED
jgi:hypothetical protein